MYSISLKSLPVVAYAHSYSSQSYTTRLSPRKLFIELTYLEKGSILATDENQSFVMKEDTVIAHIYPHVKTLHTSEYQKHLTVGFFINYKLANNEPNVLLPSNESIAMPNLKPLFTKIIDEYNLNLQVEKDFSFHPYTSIKINSLIFELLNEITNICRKTLRDDKNYGYNRYVIKAKKYILNNISSQIKVGDIASKLNISTGFLSRIFKETTNQTLIEFANFAKLYKIKELIQTKGISIKEASYQLGFSDPNYVSRLYKKYFGKNITD